MGTKHMRDLISDANFLQEAVWKSKKPDKQQQVISTSLHLASAWQLLPSPYCMLDQSCVLTCMYLTHKHVVAFLELLSLCSVHLWKVTVAILVLTLDFLSVVMRHTRYSDALPSAFRQQPLLTEASCPEHVTFLWKPCTVMPKVRASGSCFVVSFICQCSVVLL